VNFRKIDPSDAGVGGRGVAAITRAAQGGVVISCGRGQGDRCRRRSHVLGQPQVTLM